MAQAATHTDTEEKISSPLATRLDELFRHRHWAHLGPDLYSNGGAERFEAVLRGEQYTPFTGEARLIAQHTECIANWAADTEVAIIIGSGPAKSLRAKELLILKALPQLKEVRVVELSTEFNRQSVQALKLELPNVTVKPYVHDFRTVDFSGDNEYENALVISTGSLTNFEDIPSDHFPNGQVTDHLEAIKRLAKTGGKFLWGYDSHSDPAKYNVPEVSNFLLYPLNKAAQRTKEGVVIDPTKFRHETVENPAASTLCHYWITTAEQNVTVNGHSYNIAPDERYMVFASTILTPEKLEKVAALNQLETQFVKTGAQGTVIHGFNIK